MVKVETFNYAAPTGGYIEHEISATPGLRLVEVLKSAAVDMGSN